MAKAKDSGTQTVLVPPLRKTRVALTIVGRTPLLASRIPEDTLPAPGVKALPKARSKTGEELYLESRYMIDEKTHGFPAAAIKRAMIGACRLLNNKKLNMTNAPMMFHMITPDHPFLYVLKFKKCTHAVHYGRNQNATGKPLVQVHRAQYEGWSIDIVVEFNEDVLSLQDVVNLLCLAGEVGIGAWRAEKGGNNGLFEVKVGKQGKGNG